MVTFAADSDDATSDPDFNNPVVPGSAAASWPVRTSMRPKTHSRAQAFGTASVSSVGDIADTPRRIAATSNTPEIMAVRHIIPYVALFLRQHRRAVFISGVPCIPDMCDMRHDSLPHACAISYSGTIVQAV